MALESLFQALLAILSGIVVALISGYIAQLRENQQWLKEEVYRPMYNELDPASEGRLPREGSPYGTIWDGFDRYQKFRIESKLRESLNEYRTHLLELSEMESNLAGSDEILEALPSGLAERQGDEIILVHRRNEQESPSSYIDLGSWLKMFSHILIEEDDPDDMRKRLIKFSEDNNLGHERSFRKWDDEYPGWHKTFWEAFNGGEHETIADIQEFAAKKTEIANVATVLRDELERRIAEGFVPVLQRKIGLNVSTEKWNPLRGVVLNFILFSAIIPILVGLHFFLPDRIHDALLFNHDEFVIYTLWSSAYVHASNSQLFNNTFGYVMGMVPLWLIFSYHYRQWVLRRVYLIMLALFPFLISLTSYAVYRFGFGAEGVVSRGFSGIDASIFGLLFISVLKIGYDARRWAGVIGLGGAIMLVAMTRILIRAGAAPPDTIAVGVGGAILSLILLIPPDQVRERRLVPTFTDRRKVDLMMVTYGMMVLMLVLPGIFPTNWIRSDQIVDIFGHFAGLIYGMIAGIAVILWLRSRPQSHSQWFESSTQ